MFAKKIGYKVLTTFTNKVTEYLYAEKISIMFDKTENMMDHALLPNHGDKKFVLEATPGLITRVYDKENEFKFCTSTTPQIDLAKRKNSPKLYF